MTFRFHTLSFTVLSSFLALSAVACGDDGDGADGAGGDTSTGGSASGGSSSGGSSSGSELEQKIAACPVISSSSDPAASACLVGTYEGKTLAGEDCSLEVKANNAFDFSSPTLEVSYTPPSDVILTFGHTEIQGSHQLSWLVSDPISTEAFYDFKFNTRFGTGVPEADHKIEIELTEHGADATISSSCIVTL